MRTNGRATGYDKRTRDGGVNGGVTGRGTNGMGTSGGRGSTTTSRTGTGTGGDYDRGYPTTTTSNVGRDTVMLSSPGIKEPNTNISSYMTDPGASSRSGTISGTGYGTGSGTRTYTAAGDSPVTRTRDESMVPRDESGSSSRAYTVGGDLSGTRKPGDLNAGSYSRDFAPGTGTGLRSRSLEHPTGREAPRADSGGLSYMQDTASRFGLGSNGSRASEGAPSATGKMADTVANTASYIKDTAKDAASGLGLTSGSGAGSDDRAAGGDSSVVKTITDTAAGTASYVKDTAKGAATGIGLTSSGTDTSGAGPGYGGRTTSGGDTSVTRTMADTAAGTGSYIADTAKSVASGVGLTGAGTETDTETARTGHDERTSGGDTSVTKTMADTAANTGSYIADTAKNMASGVGLTSGTGTDDRTSTTGRDSSAKADEGHGTLSYIKDVASKAGLGSRTSTEKRDRDSGGESSITKTVTDTAADAGSYITDTAKNAASGIGLTSSTRTAHDNRTATPDEDTSITKKMTNTAADTASYVADTAKGAASTVGLTSSSGPGSRPESDAEYYRKDLGPGPEIKDGSGKEAHRYDTGSGTGPGSGNNDDYSSMPGAYTESRRNPPGGGDPSFPGGQGGEGAGRRAGERYTITHPGQAANRDRDEQARVEERMDREQMERDRGSRGAGERYTITHGNRETNRQTGGDRTEEYGSQPRTVRDDTARKHDQTRQELEQELHDVEQEALRIARGKNTRATSSTYSTPSPTRKYSPHVDEAQEPTERKRGREEMGSQEARRDDATTTSDIQTEKIPGGLEPILPNLEQQQALHEREVEESARESSMERHRTSDLASGSGPGGMRTTMRDSPDYADQKADTNARVVTSEKEREEEVRKRIQSQFEGDGDEDGDKKSFLGRAADKVGHMLKT